MITSTHVHPQANGQAESNNKIIGDNLKKRLDAKKGRLAEELTFVLWAGMTTSKIPIFQTPYSLVLRIEVVILTKVVIRTSRYQLQYQENNYEILAEDLHTIDDLKSFARIRVIAHQQRITKTY